MSNVILGNLLQTTNRQMSAFNEKFSRLVRQHGLNQSKAALLLEVNQKTVSNWMAGKILPNERKIRKIAEIFKVDIGILTDDRLDLASTKPAQKDISAESNKPSETYVENIASSKRRALALFPDDLDKAQFVLEVLTELYSHKRRLEDVEKENIALRRLLEQKEQQKTSSRRQSESIENRLGKVPKLI